MFGASAVEGLQKFTDIAEGVKNKFGDVFRRMGIDQDALNEHTLKYMETQVSLGGLEKKNNDIAVNYSFRRGEIKVAEHL